MQLFTCLEVSLGNFLNIYVLKLIQFKVNLIHVLGSKY